MSTNLQPRGWQVHSVGQIWLTAYDLRMVCVFLKGYLEQWEMGEQEKEKGGRGEVTKTTLCPQHLKYLKNKKCQPLFKLDRSSKNRQHHNEMYKFPERHLGLSCVPLEFVCWNPNPQIPQYECMWRWLGLNESVKEGPNPVWRCLRKRRLGHRQTRAKRAQQDDSPQVLCEGAARMWPSASEGPPENPTLSILVLDFRPPKL